MLKLLLILIRTPVPMIRRHLASTRSNRQDAHDPVQKLFVDKIREYKSKSVDGKLVDPSPEVLSEMQKEMNKLEKQFGASEGEDMTAFPSFEFEEPKLDPIDEPEPKADTKKQQPS